VEKKSGKQWILTLDKDDPEKEFDFESRWQRSLTTQERFEMMWGDEAMMWLKFVRQHEHNKTPLIVKRT
jgi:hypothetical protein